MYGNQWNYPSYNQKYSGQVLRVNGKQGASAFEMAPNCSALLLDLTAPIVWLIQTDAAGYKSMTPFDTKVHELSDPIKSFEERLARLEAFVNGKSDNANVNKSEQQFIGGSG